MTSAAGSYSFFSPKIFSPSSYFTSPQKAHAKGEVEQRVASAFEKALLALKSFNEPISIGIVAISWGALIDMTAELSNKALAHLAVIKKPFFVASFLLDLIAVQKLVRGQNKELATDPFQLSHLIFSLITRGCKIIRWMEKYGFITLAESVLWRFKLMTHLSTLLRTTFRFIEAVKELSSPLAILSSGTKVAIAALSLYSIFYASMTLCLLQLALSTANIAMIVAGA